MIRYASVIPFILLANATFAGPISKFDDKTPDFEGTSNIALFDLERCLTDLDGYVVPVVLRQPDRPNEINLIWVVSGSVSFGRVHLMKSDASEARSCIETGRPR